MRTSASTIVTIPSVSTCVMNGAINQDIVAFSKLLDLRSQLLILIWNLHWFGGDVRPWKSSFKPRGRTDLVGTKARTGRQRHSPGNSTRVHHSAASH